MTRHVLESEVDTTNTIKWSLSVNPRGHLLLQGKSETDFKNILRITLDGRIHLEENAQLDGLRTDDKGRIVLRKEVE